MLPRVCAHHGDKRRSVSFVANSANVSDDNLTFDVQRKVDEDSRGVWVV